MAGGVGAPVLRYSPCVLGLGSAAAHEHLMKVVYGIARNAPGQVGRDHGAVVAAAACELDPVEKALEGPRELGVVKWAAMVRPERREAEEGLGHVAELVGDASAQST